jgi:hypothetical protein
MPSVARSPPLQGEPSPQSPTPLPRIAPGRSRGEARARPRQALRLEGPQLLELELVGVGRTSWCMYELWTSFQVVVGLPAPSVSVTVRSPPARPGVRARSSRASWVIQSNETTRRRMTAPVCGETNVDSSFNSACASSEPIIRCIELLLPGRSCDIQDTLRRRGG